MWAACANPNPNVIVALLKEGANAKLKSHDGMTAYDYAQMNSKVKGTDAYLELKKAAF